MLGSLQQGQIKVTPRCCTSTPTTSVPTKYQLSIPYSSQKLYPRQDLQGPGDDSSQFKVIQECCTLTPPTNVPNKYKLRNLMASEILIINISDPHKKWSTAVKQEESARERALCQLTECF